MKTIHRHHAPPEPTPGATTSDTGPDADPGRPHRHEPVWRVVGGSIATGFLGAVALAVGVFPGAAEHVIAGSALLAFAAGWALLAVLSDRYTHQPQRWARVPATIMAVCGLGLLIGRPDDHVLTNAGWVWPIFGLALAAWLSNCVRSGFRGRVRWLLYPVVASIALGAAGALYETAATRHDQASHPAPGTMYDVGGYRLHLDCAGTGGPTVVVENGLGETSANWFRIRTDIERSTRICTYDRAGQGWSDDVSHPQDGLAIAADLHMLLARAGEQGPFLLVGHSAGGPYALTFAARYPDDVAGLVLLDSMSPDSFTDLPGFTREQAMMSRGLGLLPSLARLGIGRLLPTSVWSSLPEPAAGQVRTFSSSPRGMNSMRDEQSRYPLVFEQARELTSLGGKPLIVLIASESIDKHQEWVALQDRLVALSTNSHHRIVTATHGGLIDDPDGSAASAQAVHDAIHSIRTGQPVPVA